jgi:hypothetical protein
MNIYDFQKAANESYAARLADVVSDLQVLNDRIARGTEVEIERVQLEHKELVDFLNRHLEAKIAGMRANVTSLQTLCDQSIERAADTRKKILNGEITLPEARDVDILHASFSEPAEFQGLLTESGKVPEPYNNDQDTPAPLNVAAIAHRFGAGPRKRS